MLLAAMGVMAATGMATMPTEETTTQATSVVMVVLLLATTATVAAEGMLLVVSTFKCYLLPVAPTAPQRYLHLL